MTSRKQFLMTPIWKFRCYIGLVVSSLGTFAICNIAAEFERAAPFPIPITRIANSAPMTQIASADSAATIAPFRSDLRAQYALALTNQSLASEGALQNNNNETAQVEVKWAIKLGPHSSNMWLALALLQAQRNLENPQIVEALKMSYFTGPNQSDLIPSRLNIATVSNALKDSDLKELARGDVRSILLRYPDQRQFLVGDYFRGSTVGKAFLEEAVAAFDPGFLGTLRGKN